MEHGEEIKQMQLIIYTYTFLFIYVAVVGIVEHINKHF